MDVASPGLAVYAARHAAEANLRDDLLAILSRYAPLGPVEDVPELLCHGAEDVYGLWAAYEAHWPGSGPSEAPFWALAWPAARLAARWLLEHPEAVAGKRVLEIGCGGALAAIAAAKRGAAVVYGNDVAPEALIVAESNALANGVQLELLCEDALVSLVDRGPWDVVLAADFFYEREASSGVAAALLRARQAGAQVWIADGGRAFVPRDVAQRVLVEAELAVSVAVEGCATRRVRLLELLAG